MEDLLATPQARAGPTSRLLRRQSQGGGALGRPAAPRTPTHALNASMKLLDDALGSPIPPAEHYITEDVTRMMEVTRPVDSTRLATRGDHTMRSMRGDFTMAVDVTRPLETSAMLGEENPGVAATENLFQDFLSTVSSGDSGAAALDSIAELEQMVGDHCSALGRLVGVGGARERSPKTVAVLEGLINERNTWRLFGKLYTDRLVTAARPPPVLPPPAPRSEKQLIERLFQRSAAVRQAWIVVEWLERNAQDQMEESMMTQLQYFTDSTVAWENTLAALESGTGGPNMVTELDPDAPLRSGKQLHSLDQSDEARLVRALFVLVRCGLLEEGQELCCRVGQAWRAASLEGWKLFHDPNYESGTGGGAPGSKLPVEGNQHRDIWKRVAWNLAEDAALSQHERAVYAALCGNLKQLQPVCTGWEDLVWAGARCAADLMVETEVRETMVKSFEKMPSEYWNTPQSLSKVFAEIAGRGGGTAREAESPYHVIQRLIILDNYSGLVATMASWVAEGQQDPHLLRLMAHIVLLNRALGVVGDPEGEEVVVRAYTELLMAQDRLALVPWYVARLSPSAQLPLYSAFLRGVTDREDQRLCLYLGKEAGLDMVGIVVAAVELARAGSPEEMVASLGWLALDLDQAGHLLVQANCVVRKLLLSGDTDMARTAAAMVPGAVLEQATKEWKEAEGGELPGGAVREHLALQTYLSAMEAFNDWFDHFHKGQPVKPVLAEGASFTEKVAHEQRERVYQGEMERWRGGQVVQSRQAEERIRAVLVFPGGWLVEDEREEDVTMEVEGFSTDQEREAELASLRRLLVPRTVTLLHSLLHSTGQHQQCVALADTVADEGHALYQAFTPDSLRELLVKIRESALAGMEKGKDAWGYAKP